MLNTRLLLLAMAASLIVINGTAAKAVAELTQVHEDFSEDPGWEWEHNRIVAEDPPPVNQDFGWAPTNHTGAGPGEIGGTIWRSRTPAYYALPLNQPLSFKDKFSFSCRITFMPTSGSAVAYLGFFNHALQGWRVWNSMALRLSSDKMPQHVMIGADAMNALWHSGGSSEGFFNIPADGKPHTLRFSYDPEGTVGDWPDPRLEDYLTSQRQTADEILTRARQDEAELTYEELWERLAKAHAAGKINHLDRRGGTTSGQIGEFWYLDNQSGAKGAMTIQIDETLPFNVFISERSQNEPAYMDRFGLFNFQMYHGHIDLYLSDLTINGEMLNLEKDPGWEGKGNRVQFLEHDFHRHDYGFSETNWAGEQIGEIGGFFSNVEPIDPLTGYYGDAIGELSLDDPLSFSGNVCFIADSTDSGMQIGYFRAADAVAKRDPKKFVRNITNFVGVQIEGPAARGKSFMPHINTNSNLDAANGDIPFKPTKDSHAFTFKYDPTANNNVGRITVTLDDKRTVLDLTPEQRADGANFDRFGLTNLRAGGKFVVVYFDDLTYTARRPKDYEPEFHKQQVLKVPYPEGGRKY